MWLRLCMLLHLASNQRGKCLHYCMQWTSLPERKMSLRQMLPIKPQIPSKLQLGVNKKKYQTIPPKKWPINPTKNQRQTNYTEPNREREREREQRKRQREGEAAEAHAFIGTKPSSSSVPPYSSVTVLNPTFFMSSNSKNTNPITWTQKLVHTLREME